MGLSMQEAQETQIRYLGRKIPWRRKWQPSSVFLPGESQGRRKLADYSPWGRKELDTTEQLRTRKRNKMLSGEIKGGEQLGYV